MLRTAVGFAGAGIGVTGRLHDIILFRVGAEGALTGGVAGSGAGCRDSGHIGPGMGDIAGACSVGGLRR